MERRSVPPGDRRSLAPPPGDRRSIAPPAGDRRSIPPPGGGGSDLGALVRSLSRALRALGYYDAAHPVVVQTLADAGAATQRLCAGGRVVTLAGAGAALIADATAPALADEPARILADALFQRAVIALRIDGRAQVADLAAVLASLADAPDRVRLAGGVAAAVSAARAAGVEAVEIDFRALFAGDRGSLPLDVTSDPIVSRALKEVLRFEQERGRAGEAVTVDFEALADVESLGGFLDDLVDAAEPGARSSHDPGRRRPPPARSALRAQGRDLSVSVDDVADLAAEAYLKNQSLQADRGAGEGELVAGAQVLADALVRLSPEGRFALLRRLAGQDHAADAREAAAVERLGARVDRGLVVEAVAAAIATEGAESEVVQAVGNLVRRLFPVEAERQRILGALDQDRRRAGQPLGGALWQELSARALGQSGLGMLELDLESPRRKLIANARARARGQVPHVAGQEVLAARGPAATAPVLARVLTAALRDKRELGAPLLAGVASLVATLEDHDQPEQADLLLDALLERAEAAPQPAVTEAVAQLLSGPRGGARTVRMVRASGGGSTRTRGELLLRAMEEAPDKAARDELVQRLLRFDPRTIEALGEALAEAPPARVANLLHVATRMDGRTAAQVAKSALKSGSVRTKQLALTALIESAQGPALALLGVAAGAKGDDPSRRLLALGTDPASEKRLQELQVVATSALGLSRSPEAVPHLIPLLTRQSLLPSRFVEEQRAEAARALAINGSADAMTILKAGAEHKKKNVREACERALRR